MSRAALDHAARFTWESTARHTLQVLADAAIAMRGPADISSAVTSKGGS